MFGYKSNEKELQYKLSVGKEKHLKYRKYYKVLSKNQKLDVVEIVHQLKSIFKLERRPLKLGRTTTVQAFISQL